MRTFDQLRKPWLVVAGLLVLLGMGLLTTFLPVLAQNPSQEQTRGIPTAPRGKKLVLKDGSFQLVREYERQGDRVRYYSVERSAWEEIPLDLVDWEATRKAEEDEARETQELLEKARAAEMAAKAAEVDVDASIEVAPGIFLPPGEGLFAVDGTAVVPLVSVGAEVKLDKGRLLTQILVPIPVISSRHRIRVAGKKASIRLTSSEPEFYFRTADEREPEIELLQAQVKGDNREVEVVDTNVAGGQSRHGKTIPIQRWDVARGVYRFTMGQKLEPGEYAVAEYIPDTGMSLYLWDFGVDASRDSPRDKSKPAPGKEKKQ